MKTMMVNGKGDGRGWSRGVSGGGSPSSSRCSAMKRSVHSLSIVWSKLAMSAPFPPASSSSSPNRSVRRVSASQPKADEEIDLMTDENVHATAVEEQKTVRVAIIGTPNAGKSVIVNRLVGTKISAESAKRHTTRKEIMGVLTEGDTQLVLCDTPGIVAERERGQYESTLVRSPWESLVEVDVAMVVIDAAKRLYEPEHQMLIRLRQMQDTEPERAPNLFLVLNKVDLVHPKIRLLDVAEHVNKQAVFDTTHFTSGTTGEGFDELIADLLEEAKPGEWHYSSDARTDLSLHERVEEIVKEKIFQRFHEELPYKIQQKLEEALENEDGTVVVRHTLVVQTQGQKRILEGKSRLKLKDIEKEAAEGLTNMIGQPVKFQLHIKVAKP